MSEHEAHEPMMCSQWPGLKRLSSTHAMDGLGECELHHAPELLAGVEPSCLSESGQARVSRLQDRINARYSLLSCCTYAPSAVQPTSETGFHRKTVVDLIYEGNVIERALHKPMPQVDAAKVEFVTILCNLLGLYTPLSVMHDVRIEGENPCTTGGVSTRFLENAQVVPNYDFSKASPKVLRYAFMSRWINELVGNLHCWWAQFLVPLDAAKTYTVMVMVDLDEAFNSVSPEFLRQALVSFFGKQHVRLKDCQWLNREFTMEERIAWRPDHYDSCFNVYGYLLRDFVLGKAAAELDCLIPIVERIDEVPNAVFINAMSKFLDVSRAYYKNSWVLLPAARNPKQSTESFRDRFIDRIRRSSREFIEFLGELNEARENRRHEMYKFYSTMMERPY